LDTPSYQTPTKATCMYSFVSDTSPYSCKSATLHSLKS